MRTMTQVERERYTKDLVRNLTGLEKLEAEKKDTVHTLTSAIKETKTRIASLKSSLELNQIDEPPLQAQWDKKSKAAGEKDDVEYDDGTPADIAYLPAGRCEERALTIPGEIEP